MAQRPAPPSSNIAPLPPPTAAASPPPDATASAALYTLEEALADALLAPLQHIGTGPWQGIQRSYACAYQNGRVIVVDVYCSVKEGKAVRIDFYSPTRGRARLYAEASRPISQLSRHDYFSFTGETQPAPLRREHLPPLRFTMSMAELSDYERQRYEKFLPTCYGGIEHNRPQGGCLGELAPQARTWTRINQPFLDRPPAQWYRLINELRTQAVAHGRDP
ncbi:MAG: hypothetical protein SF187_01495 [Deltaproteobacteria bacterium]|nr:hypothetical protein [Deltaproteobacteria bacterium]